MTGQTRRVHLLGVGSMELFVMVSIAFCLISVQAEVERCSRAVCFPPRCTCPSRRGPLELSLQDTPQIVMFTFDDAVNEQNFKFYKKLFTKRKLNPNGCPVQATFFVSHDWTNYNFVRDLYLDGHEIASHSVTHRLPRNWWAKASYEDWVAEMDGQRSNINKKAKLPRATIKGLRVPFLEIAGDTQFRMMADYEFEYDASFIAGPYREGDWRTAVWPYTLEYPPGIEYCDSVNCPQGNFSGIWEIPLNRWIGLDGRACPMVDACSTQNLLDKEHALKYLWKNFNRFHTNGRTPFGVNVHATWFQKEFKFEAMKEFLQDLVARDDIYIVTMHQLVEWMKKPTPLNELKEFEPWKTSCKKGRLLVGKPMSKKQGKPRKKQDQDERENVKAKTKQKKMKDKIVDDDRNIHKYDSQDEASQKHIRMRKPTPRKRVLPDEDNETDEIVKETKNFISSGRILKDGRYDRDETSAAKDDGVENNDQIKPRPSAPRERGNQVNPRKFSATGNNEERQIQNNQMAPGNLLRRHGYRSDSNPAVAMTMTTLASVAMVTTVIGYMP